MLKTVFVYFAEICVYTAILVYAFRIPAGEYIGRFIIFLGDKLGYDFDKETEQFVKKEGGNA